MREWDDLVKPELNKIKNLPDDKANQWIIHLSREGCLWEDDTVTEIPNIASVTESRLASIGITTVKQLANVCATNVQIPPNMLQSTFYRFIAIAKTALPGTCHLQPKDYQKEANPYFERYCNS